MFVSPNPTMFSCHIFSVWVAKANPMQTAVNVLSHAFSGARGEEYCATIYQMTPWIWWHSGIDHWMTSHVFSYIKLWNDDLSESWPKKRHPPTYPNFSDRVGSGETKIMAYSNLSFFECVHIWHNDCQWCLDYNEGLRSMLCHWSQSQGHIYF